LSCTARVCCHQLLNRAYYIWLNTNCEAYTLHQYIYCYCYCYAGKAYPVRVATRYYKSPEIICDVRDYSYSLDLWGVGCTLGSMLFRTPVLFRGEDEFDQLVKIANVLGTESLYAFLTKYAWVQRPSSTALMFWWTALVSCTAEVLCSCSVGLP
jgi:serine/threonine protein kinase